MCIVEVLQPYYRQYCHADGGNISASSSAIQEKKVALWNRIMEIPRSSG